MTASPLAERLLAGDPRAIARAISLIEDEDPAGADLIRAVFAHSGRAYLINEVHALRKPVIRQLLVLLERIPPHVVIVFTTTCEGQEARFEDYDDASLLLSRCLRLDLARRDLSRPFVERAKLIAEAEGLDGLPIERYVRLAQLHRNNQRAMLQAIDGGELVG